MPVSRAGSRVGPLDRGEADVTAIDHPRVSVALPVHNCERYVAEAIESILAQTFTDFEFLIVDDGSTDGTLPILHRFAARDSRIRVISRPNTGIVGALNEMWVWPAQISSPGWMPMTSHYPFVSNVRSVIWSSIPNASWSAVA